MHFLVFIYLTLQWKLLVIRNIHPLSSIPLLVHCSTLLVAQAGLQVQECEVVGPEGGRGTAQLPDVASAKARRARGDCCVILTGSSAMQHRAPLFLLSIKWSALRCQYRK